MPRSYDMTNRARAAAATRDRIVDATEGRLARGPLTDVTLQAIADDAGVTVQTVLRHLGSRDGCVDAVAARVAQRTDRDRGGSEPGDIHGAISGLVAHYERDGRLVLNLLAQEGGHDDFARSTVERGRRYHRAWVERCFGPHLDEPASDVVDALVVATDLYAWKVLRLDLKRTVRDTETVLDRMVRSILEVP